MDDEIESHCLWEYGFVIGWLLGCAFWGYAGWLLYHAFAF